MNARHVKRCVKAVLDQIDLKEWTVQDVSTEYCSGFDLTLHAPKVSMQQIDNLSKAMKTKRINFMGKTEEYGYGCESGCTNTKEIVVIEVWDAEISLDIVPEEETKKDRLKWLSMSEYVPEPPIEPAKPKTDPGHYLLVASFEDAQEWCRQRRVTPGQAILVEDLALESTYGLGKDWKIVTIGSRKTGPFTKELVDALLAKGYSLLEE